MSFIRAPPKLQDLAFHVILKETWLQSKLPRILVDNIDRNQVRTDQVDFITSIGSLHRMILSKLQAKMMEMDLPTYWQRKLAVGLQGLDKEITNFADELVSNLLDGKRENIITCCSSLTFDNEGVDKLQTVFNILYGKKFNAFFTKGLLAYYFYGSKILEKLYGRITREKHEEWTQKEHMQLIENMNKVRGQIGRYWIRHRTRKSHSQKYWEIPVPSR